jgi:hypothetical protein
MKGNIKQFVEEAFDYYDTLLECAIDRSVDMYLLEYIADGLSKYGGVNGFIKNVDKWLRSVCKIYKEIGFNDETNEIHAVIDLHDQLVVIDHRLYDDLKLVIKIIDKYGLIIEFNEKGSKQVSSTTLSKFFEVIQEHYPKIKERYKGLGSSDADVTKTLVMDPLTRRLIQVTMDNPNTERQLGMLMGEGKYNILGRKEMLSNFKFDKTMIDN